MADMSRKDGAAARDANTFEMVQFLDMCLLAGCDYLTPISGLGIKTAHKLIKLHRTYKRVRSEGRLVAPAFPFSAQGGGVFIKSRSFCLSRC